MKDYPVIKLAIGIVSGILVQSVFRFDLIFIIIATVILSVILIILKKNKLNVNQIVNQILKFILYTSFGIITFELNSNQINTNLGEFIKEKNAFAYGKIYSIFLKKDYEVSFELLTDSIIINDNKIITKEKLLCRLRSSKNDRIQFYENLKPGNYIYFKGTLAQAKTIRNPGEFDYRKYLISKGISAIITSYEDSSYILIRDDISSFQNTIFSIRKFIDEVIHKTHSKKTAGLLRGLLLADRSEIDSETKLNFINAGVIHILAVSGLHVGYILLFFIVLFGRFNLFVRSFLIILGLFLFMLITGVPASVFRATLMATIVIIAILTNRSTNILNSISLSAVIILLYEPLQLFNPGFQLSYAAVLSIALIYPLIKNEIENLLINNETLKKILLFIGVSLSTQIGTMPFTIYYFNKISMIALLSNLVVIPLTALVVALGILTTIIGSINTYLASFLGITNNLFVEIVFKVVNYSGELDFSHIRISNYSLFDGIIFYFFISIFIYAFNRFTHRALKILFTILITLNIFIFSKIDDKELLKKGKLNILMIDVDQGDSFLIKFPNQKTALIDAGMANPFIDKGEKVIIPLLDYLGINKIDIGFVSHFDNDHYGGFVSLIENFRIKEVFIPEPDSSSKSKKFISFLERKNVPYKIYHKNKIMFENTAVYILNDTSSSYFNNLSSNDRSGIKKIVYGNTSFLFVGDLEYPGEIFYTIKYNKVLDSDVLKVSHHGSKTATSEKFLSLVTPQISLISAGIKNKFGHPSEIVLERLKKFNSKILRTDSSGAILLQSDGNKIDIIDWRNY